MKKYKRVPTKRAVLAVLFAIVIVFGAEPQASQADANHLSAGYKKASSMGAADITDPFQKNYTSSSAVPDSTYLYKFAEWTDIKKGKARITIKCRHKYTSTAVYAFTTCTAHGFSKEVCEANIRYLLKYYDKVDIIGINAPDVSGIKIIRDVRPETAGQVLGNFDWGGGRHWASMIYPALTRYLMGSADSQTQVRSPSCIYVSLDGYGYPLLDSKDYNDSTWKTLVKYRQENRYYSSVNENRIVVSGGASSDMQDMVLTGNTVAGLYDPACFPGKEAASFYNNAAVVRNGLLYMIPCIGGHMYKDKFGSAGYASPAYEKANVTDTVGSSFRITGVTTDSDDAEVLVRDNRVSVTDSGRTLENGLTVSIAIELKDQQSSAEQNKWIDTNSGNAEFDAGDGGEPQTASSPKLYMPGSGSQEQSRGTIRISPVWNDSNDARGMRPSRVKVRLLYADGRYAGRTAVLTAENGWTMIFTGLDSDISKYRIAEAEIPGYTAAYSKLGNEYTIINTHSNIKRLQVLNDRMRIRNQNSGE